MFHRIRFAILKKRIKNNPYIGKEDIDGTYLYKEDGYSIRYRIIKLSGDKIGIEWVSMRRRFTALEEGVKRIKKEFFDFWHYQRWLIFFRPSILLLLIMAILLFYSEVIENQEVKMERFKRIVASIVGITPQDIRYIGDGYLAISGQRRKEDGTKEPIKYTFNPLRWLFFSEGGLLTRWRGEPFGYATHPVVFNDRGDVWIKKKDTPWQHGIISGETIKWDTPVGSSKVTEQEKISTEDRKLKIIDK